MSDSAAPVTNAPAAPAATTPSAPQGQAPTGRQPNGQFAKTSASDIQAQADAKAAKTPEAPPAAETAAEKKARILRGKVNGQDVEWDVDSMDDATLAKKLQMAEAFHKRTNELSAREKRIHEALEYGKQDPTAAMKELLGIDDPRAFMEKYLTEHYTTEAKKAQMTPEQIENEKYKSELEQYKAREAKAKAARETQAREAFENKILADTKATFGEALELAGLPKTQKTMFELAKIAKWNMQHGIKLTPQQLASELRSEMADVNKSVLSGLKGDKLLEALGEDVINEAIRAKLAKNRVPVPQAPQAQEATPAKTPDNLSRLPFHLRARMGLKK